MINFIKKLFKRNGSDEFNQLQNPKKHYEVKIDNEKISCERSDGTIETVYWNDLQKFEVHTTDLGPIVEDVFWVLHGTETGCVIPQEADTGNLLSKLQELDGFDNSKFIDAMSCTDNNVFLIWTKQ